MISEPFTSFLENLLSWTSKRQQAIASNIANLDTPGYRAKDYSFEQVLSGLQLRTTSDRHITVPRDDSPARVFEVQSKVVRANGNNVDLDREMTEMTKNAMQFVTLIQVLNQKMRTLRSSIDEGGRR